MAFYLQNPKTGEKVPFTSTSGIDYQMYLKSGYVPISGGTANTEQGIDLSKYGISRNEFGSITTAPTAALLDDYENIQPITGTGPGGSMITIGYTGTLIPKTTVIDPNTGNRVVVRTDSSSSRFPNINDLQSRGYVTEKAPGIASTGQTFGGAADLSQNPDIRLASGQVISHLDPNYSYYANIPGSTRIPSSTTGTIGVQTAPQQINAPIPFKSGLTSAQQQSIQTLVSQKPTSQWTATDKANWAYATNNSPLPSATTSTPTSPIGGMGGNIQGAGQGYTGMEGVATSPYQGVIDATQAYIDKMNVQGMVINPSIEITPEMTQRFLEQAKTEMEPYYRQIFQQAQEDLKRAGERISSGAKERERQLGLQYGQQLESTQESFARRGLSLSSEREKAEKTLAEQAQEALKSSTQEAAEKAQDVGTQYERQFGSSFFQGQLPSFQSSITSGTRPLTGVAGGYGFQTGAGSQNLFTPTGGVLGETERQRTYQEESRKNELLANERQLRGLMTM